jgi:hypothetical protein
VSDRRRGSVWPSVWTVTFARASEQLVRSLTIRCSRNGEQVSTLVEEAPAGWERAKDDAIAGSCDGP